jgi:N-acetylglucosaminyldiphosphoundecaprenol N-acetyl-beta-D-mannosaminyltransferase
MDPRKRDHVRVDVLGVQISAIDLEEAVVQLGTWINQGASTYVCVTGVHGVMESQRDHVLKSIHNHSGMTTPDGMPMVWASRWAGVRDARRVYGPDLMLAACAQAATAGWRSFFYGGKPGVASQLAANLEIWFPGLQVAGIHSPPFRDLTPAEDQQEVEMINATQPDLVWVGLSTPKQERWMANHLGRVDARVMIGVGAAFDIHSGNLAQAPKFVQRAGLEWLYRLGQEPERLWRRYLRNNPSFIFRIMRNPPRLISRANP